ncbi:MAG: orotidine 5'-phosphate decarboxylase / HUMPS family protein [Pseudomonadota bacterium]
MKTPWLFVAFDSLRDRFDETIVDMYNLSETGERFGIKINLDAVLNDPGGGSIWLDRVTRLGRSLFVDLKMWNGKRTMTDIAKMLVDAHVDYFNVWVQADDQLTGAVKATEGSKTKILGVTVLTHYNDDWCRAYFRRSLEETVVFLTQRAKDLGLHGVILPGTCLSAIKDINLIKAVPGIRAEDLKDDRHKQEVTPEFAAQNGADIVVCGSPIMKASDKVSALRKVLLQLSS